MRLSHRCGGLIQLSISQGEFCRKPERESGVRGGQLQPPLRLIIPGTAIRQPRQPVGILSLGFAQALDDFQPMPRAAFAFFVLTLVAVVLIRAHGQMKPRDNALQQCVLRHCLPVGGLRGICRGLDVVRPSEKRTNQLADRDKSLVIAGRELFEIQLQSQLGVGNFVCKGLPAIAGGG